MFLTLEPLRIGIDARAAAEVPAGRGRVVRELLRALSAQPHDRHRYLLYARRACPELELDERFSWRLIGARDPRWHSLAGRDASRDCDAFLASNSYLSSLLTRIPTVTIVYDLTTFERSMRPNRRSSVIERLTLGPAVRRSKRLLAISQATADALGQRFPAARGRTVVAPLGVSPTLSDEPAANGAPLPDPGFVLAVGTLEPRKNLPRLVAAYSTLDRELQESHPLVVVGALGWQTGETLEALRGLGDRATVLGYVSDGALAEMYRRCSVFCYPSLGEGFGLPVLEAMAAGAAVLTSRISSLPEVGGDAVEYVDPHDVPSIAGGLRTLLEDDPHRAELARRGAERAREFSWSRFATTVLGALDEAAGASLDAETIGALEQPGTLL
ncbi:MAG TPA: glycosyltransferase family 1 protein [Solirubrobacteraceae bacterium]|jgi:glycosyltransferase involved in cell wall biosynthesis|nr:glycosyltransferase family 1 protein [Solirubrobacteraceae bacterium]